ncbi:hypothetical protein ACM23_05660, partial [Helicobacter pylori]
MKSLETSLSASIPPSLIDIRRFRRDAEYGFVRVPYRYKKGDMVYMHDVIISGNQRPRDRIIRRA